MSDENAAGEELYRPRRMGLLGHVRFLALDLKLYGIAAEGWIDAGERAAAERVLGNANLPANGEGFAIVHRGEEALWLLAHWWLPGGILAELLWRSDLGGAVDFRPVDRPLMACVWELVPIAFEREAYVATLMNGAGRADYLGRVLPNGRY